MLWLFLLLSLPTILATTSPTRSPLTSPFDGPVLTGIGGLLPSAQGSAVAISTDGFTLAVGAPQDDTFIGAVWVWVRSGFTWTQEALLRGSGSDGTSNQGASVALSANGDTLAVGAPIDGFLAGAVWVWVRSAGIWAQQGPKIAPAEGGLKGWSVALSADGNTLACSGSELIEAGQGSVRIFTRSAGVWTKQGPTLMATGVYWAPIFTYFGWYVDLTDDGNTVVLGSNAADNTTGAAWIWVRSAGVWTQQGPLLSQGFNTSFGRGVSVDGNTLAIGASYDSTGVGATWVYTRSGSTWSLSQKLVATSGKAQQGTSVSLRGDTLVVGGPGENSAWVWKSENAVWEEFSREVGGSQMGTSVATTTGLMSAGAPGANSAWVFYLPPFTQSPTFAPTLAPVILFSPDEILQGSLGTREATTAYCTSRALYSAMNCTSGAAVLHYTTSALADLPSIAGFSTGAFIEGPTAEPIALQWSDFVDALGTPNTPLTRSLAVARVTSLRPWVGLRDNCEEWGSTGCGLNGHTPDPGSLTPGDFAVGFRTACSAGAVVMCACAGGRPLGTAAPFTRSPTTSPTTSRPTASPTHFPTLSPSTAPTRSPSKISERFVGTGFVGTPQIGTSTAVSADGYTLCAGGPNDDFQVPTAGLGAVWVWIYAGGTWTQQAKLVPTGYITPPTLGSAVALNTDGNTLAAGGVRDNTDVGAVWIFTRSGTSWSQQAKLTPTGNSGASRCGISVAISSDGDTVCAGGNADASSTGAVWVWVRTGTSWALQGSKLVGTSAAGFGRSISMSFDGNRFATGGPDYSTTGAVWVFLRTGTTWAQEQGPIVGTGSSGNAFQGTAISLNWDGNTIAVGGAADNSLAGAVWVFARSGTTWSQQGSKLTVTGNTGNAGTGSSVALSIDGDTMVVGGSADNTNAGATWIFRRASFTWSQSGTKFVGGSAVNPSRQGYSVAISGIGIFAAIGGSSDDGGIGAVWSYNF